MRNKMPLLNPTPIQPFRPSRREDQCASKTQNLNDLSYLHRWEIKRACQLDSRGSQFVVRSSRKDGRLRRRGTARCVPATSSSSSTVVSSSSFGFQCRRAGRNEGPRRAPGPRVVAGREAGLLGLLVRRERRKDQCEAGGYHTPGYIRIRESTEPILR